MLRTKERILQEMGVLGVKLMLRTEVTRVELGRNAFKLFLRRGGASDVTYFDQVVNAGGYAARLLDHQIGDRTQYSLFLKTWNMVRHKREPHPLPPFYVVRGDFMHYSPVGDGALSSLITATNEGSYLDTRIYSAEDPSLPTDWIEILDSGLVPMARERQRIILEYAGDNFLRNLDLEPVDLIPGVAVSFSSSRQDRTKRHVNQVVPGWQTIVPTKATNAIELANEARVNAVEYAR